MNERQALEALAQRLTTYIHQTTDRNFILFELRQPMKLTVVKNSQFSKKAFIGGEKFLLDSAYVGKRGKLVCIFQPDTPNKFVDSVEMLADEAKEHLTGFAKFLDNFLEFDAVKVEEEKREMVSRLRENELFGSW